MRDVVFEVPRPVETVFLPQWISFIYKVNGLALEADQGKPFGAPRKEIDRGYARGDSADYVSVIGIGIYEEALIIHTSKKEGKVGVVRFKPTTPRVRALLHKAAESFSEANVTTPDDRGYIGDYYIRQRALIEALEIQLEDAYDNAGDPETIACIERQLEKARVID